MISNPNDDRIWKVIDELRQMLTANPLRHGAIDEDGIEVFDGATIRFLEGGGIVIEGDGFITMYGDLTGTGEFTWSGPWKCESGDGEIAGNVKLTGDFDLTGKFTSEGIRIEDGKIHVGEGTSQITIDGATGRITVQGDSPIVLQTVGTEARLSVGGAILRAFGAFGATFGLGNFRWIVDSVKAAVSGPNSEVAARDGLVTVDGSVRFDPNDIPYASGTGLVQNALLIDMMGNLFRSDGT